MRKVLRPILILLAIIFLIEAWLWDRLEPIVARIVGLIPLERIKATISEWIVGLPPAGTFIVFIVPLVMAVPFKLFGFWLLANGDLSAALGVLIAAKFITLAITAFVFDVTRDKLLQLDWFRIFYEYVMLLRASAEALINPIKRRIRRRMRLLMPRRSQRAFRLLMRIRRRMHVPQPAQ
jgi:hypothetical protein